MYIIHVQFTSEHVYTCAYVGYTCTCPYSSSTCIHVYTCRYYYCARPLSQSHAVKFGTGGIYTIVLGEEITEKEVHVYVHVHVKYNMNTYCNLGILSADIHCTLYINYCTCCDISCTCTVYTHACTCRSTQVSSRSIYMYMYMYMYT